MRHSTGIYKTTKNFMQGDWKKDLQPEMIKEFDVVYHEAEQW